jgi:hypothetical protein
MGTRIYTLLVAPVKLPDVDTELDALKLGSNGLFLFHRIRDDCLGSPFRKGLVVLRCSEKSGSISH